MTATTDFDAVVRDEGERIRAFVTMLEAYAGALHDEWNPIMIMLALIDERLESLVSRACDEGHKGVLDSAVAEPLYSKDKDLIERACAIVATLQQHGRGDMAIRFVEELEAAARKEASGEDEK